MTKEEIFAKLQTEVTIRGLSPGTYYTYILLLGERQDALCLKACILYHTMHEKENRKLDFLMDFTVF